MLGVGSAESAGGDKDDNGRGIVMNHAYAILQVKEYQNELLLQLRNPHGSTYDTQEWTGDWADDSEKWTNRAKQRLLDGKPPSDPNEENPDGIFWMNSTDLLQNFKYFYTCRILTEKEGWFKSSQKGNLVKSVNMYHLPQFKLVINEPGTAFIQIRQLGDQASTFKGNNSMAFICSDEDGKKMQKINRRSVVAKSKMSAVLVAGDEVYFEKGQSYPKVYTLTIATNGQDPVENGGEPNFEISAFTKNENSKVECF